MGLLLISVFFIILNIVLWIFLLSRFNKKFSTEDIINATRVEMNNLIADVNRNTARDIELIDDKLKELRAFVAEVDRHFSVLKNEMQKMNDGKAFTNSIKNASPARTVPVKSYNVRTAAEKYSQNAVTGERAPLFDTYEQSSIISSAGTEFVVQQEMPEVIYSSEPIDIKKDFNTRVKELYYQGNTVDEIAAQLSRSTIEVQCVIDMGD